MRFLHYSSQLCSHLPLGTTTTTKIPCRETVNVVLIQEMYFLTELNVKSKLHFQLLLYHVRIFEFLDELLFKNSTSV